MRNVAIFAGFIFSAISQMVPPVVAQQTGTLQPPTASVHEIGAPAKAPVVVKETEVNTTTTTTTTSTLTPALKPAATIQRDQPVSVTVVQHHLKRKFISPETAYKMAGNHWLDKAVEADPTLVESICNHYLAALRLAHHPRIGEIAQHDHYTCRRLTKWKTVARALAKNGDCVTVVALDPEGIYAAIKRDPGLVGILAKNPQYAEMITENPDLGRLISLYM